MKAEQNSTPEGMQRKHKTLFPPQITRILFLIVVIIALYFTAHHFLVPASFGQYGWYRGNALKEIANQPIYFAGRQACAECHSDVVAKKAKSGHKGLSCESCHDASAAHADDPESFVPVKPKDPRFCVRCHEATPARPAKFPQVDSNEHAGKQACAKCHIPHTPTEAPTP